MSIETILHGIRSGWQQGVAGLLGLGITAGSVIDMSDAPGGDLSLDDIFGENSSLQTTVEPTANEPQDLPVTTTNSAEPVIKTKTGTVYKSIEDAVSGIEHKDALIAQLREQVKQNTGNDPLRSQPVNRNTPVSYTDNQEKYFEDIADAVARKDTGAYMAAQQKLIWDSLGPLAPTISNLSKANAERVVSEEMPEFKGFLSSQQYTNIATKAPLLAEAIRSAESNPAAAAQLPELYRVAYLASQGSRMPELIQSVRNETPPIQPRPTVHSTPISAPAITGVPVAAASLDNSAGRKVLIEQMENRGVGNLKW